MIDLICLAVCTAGGVFLGNRYKNQKRKPWYILNNRKWAILGGVVGFVTGVVLAVSLNMIDLVRYELTKPLELPQRSHMRYYKMFKPINPPQFNKI